MRRNRRMVGGGRILVGRCPGLINGGCHGDNEQSGRGIGVMARNVGSPGPTHTEGANVAAGYTPNGTFAVWYNLDEENGNSPDTIFLSQSTGWNLRGRDVHLGFDVFGRRVALTAWPADMARSDAVHLSGALPTGVPDQGTVGFWFAVNGECFASVGTGISPSGC